MSTRNSNEQKMIDALGSAPDSTVDDLAAAVGIGRTSTRKYLAALTDEGKVKRVGGGREGKRKLPGCYSLLAGQEEPGASAALQEKPQAAEGKARLRPGELDGLVLAFMRKHKEAPFGPSTVAKSLQRSSGAVANCFDRLASREEVSQVSQRPRRYELKS